MAPTVPLSGEINSWLDGAHWLGPWASHPWPTRRWEEKVFQFCWDLHPRVVRLTKARALGTQQIRRASGSQEAAPVAPRSHRDQGREGSGPLIRWKKNDTHLPRPP